MIQNKGGWEFYASCATCVSKATVDGQHCYLNTFTFKTHCECASLEFADCRCWKSTNFFGTFVYIFLPVITLAVIIILHSCRRHSFCPMAKMEAELANMEKANAKKKKESGGSFDGML